MKCRSIQLVMWMNFFAVLPLNAQEDSGRAAQGGVRESQTEEDEDSAFEAVEASKARSMSTNIVSALDSLSQRISDAQTRLPGLAEALNTSADKLNKAIQYRSQYMTEFRKGLFCSGCNKTKSQILAAKETFPHPGQSIVRPTEEEIEEKDSELRKVEEHLRREHARAYAGYSTAKGTVDEGLEQMRYGILLWRTSSTFEENLIGERATNAMREANKLKTSTEAETGESDDSQVKPSNDSAEKLRSAKSVEDRKRKACAASLVSLLGARTREQQQIGDFIGRLPTPLVVGTNSQYIHSGTGEGITDLGGKFLLGRLQVDGAAQEVPLKKVSQFVDDFRRSAFYTKHGLQWRVWLSQK